MLRSLCLAALAVGAVALAFACGSSDDDSAGGAPSPDGSTTVPPAATTPPGDGDGGPGGTPGQIKHVVVVVKENHTFDNYFGTFPGAEGTTTCKYSDGTTFPCPHAPDFTPRDMDHSHAAALTDWNDGKMDGWDKVAGSTGSGSTKDNLAYAQYHYEDIPNYWTYATKYTLADHFFAGMLGPSFPGHTFTLAAQAGWALGNPNVIPYWGCDDPDSSTIAIESQAKCQQDKIHPCFDIPSIPDVLPAGVRWKFYGTAYPGNPEVWSMFDAIKNVRWTALWNNVVSADQWDTDIATKQLPEVSWLVDQDNDDEHPQYSSVCAGENWTVRKLNKLMASDYWKDTAILFTMDDFGGWYDHVPPPRQYGCDTTKPYGLGFRLPLIIMSPYARPHFILKDVAEHASIARFIEKVFGAQKTLHDLDPAAQDADANDLMGAFDFAQKPLAPTMLEERNCPPIPINF